MDSTALPPPHHKAKAFQCRLSVCSFRLPGHQRFSQDKPFQSPMPEYHILQVYEYDKLHFLARNHSKSGPPYHSRSICYRQGFWPTRTRRAYVVVSDHLGASVITQHAIYFGAAAKVSYRTPATPSDPSLSSSAIRYSTVDSWSTILSGHSPLWLSSWILQRTSCSPFRDTQHSLVSDLLATTTVPCRKRKGKERRLPLAGPLAGKRSQTRRLHMIAHPLVLGFLIKKR